MAEPLKNVYSSAYIERLAAAIQAGYPVFETAPFCQAVFADDWPTLELKARMTRIRQCLHQAIALPYAEAIEVLWQPVQQFGSFEAMFFPEFIQAYGLNDWDTSMRALAWFTQFSSSEFAVRPFIEADTPRMMRQMQRWANDDNYHVRRLASEGCRPRLPWAPALSAFKQDPTPIWPILERLKCDPSDYVRRSVANNLNDISKDHPETGRDWCTQRHGQQANTDWIIKHACRGLLKASHPQALALFGYAAPTHITVDHFSVNQSRLHEGDELTLSAALSSTRALGKLRCEYLIHYVKANGKTAPKVFILSEAEHQERHKRFQRKQSFARMTTRRHYPGEHRIELRVNGLVLAATTVEVLAGHDG